MLDGPWLSIGCDGVCAAGTDDELSAWPELPQSPAAAVAWVREHGCPDCGSLDVEVSASYLDAAGAEHLID